MAGGWPLASWLFGVTRFFWSRWGRAIHRSRPKVGGSSSRQLDCMCDFCEFCRIPLIALSLPSFPFPVESTRCRRRFLESIYYLDVVSRLPITTTTTTGWLVKWPAVSGLPTCHIRADIHLHPSPSSPSDPIPPLCFISPPSSSTGLCTTRHLHPHVRYRSHLRTPLTWILCHHHAH